MGETADPRGMLIDVFDLAHSAATASGSMPLADARRLRSALAAGDGVIAFELQGYEDERGRPCARLRLRGSLPLSCDRCGKALALAVEHTADFRFVGSEAELERLPVTVDEIEPLVGSRRFALLDLVEDESILCIPVSPRHADCTVRGSEQAVAAPEDESRRPFAGLADLKRNRS
jgi:uncharacterized protein